MPPYSTAFALFTWHHTLDGIQWCGMPSDSNNLANFGGSTRNQQVARRLRLEAELLAQSTSTNSPIDAKREPPLVQCSPANALRVLQRTANVPSTVPAWIDYWTFVGIHVHAIHHICDWLDESRAQGARLLASLRASRYLACP